MNYQEAIRIAEEREKKLRTAFEKFDLDGSQTIDIEEVLPLLDDLGMIKKMRSDRIEFCTKKFVETDTNQDGTLNFEEFKGFYNAAIDDAAGKKPKPKAKKGGNRVESEGELARIKAAEDSCRKKAEESEKIRKENAEIKAKICGKGGDPKAHEGEIMDARRKRMLERQQKKKAEADRIKAENIANKKKLKNVKSKTDDDVNDDVVDLDGDGIADGTAGEQRKKKAAEGKEKVAARDQEFKDRQAHIDKIKKETKAVVDDDLLDDLVDVDGDGVADMTQEEARKKKVAEGEEKVAAREQEFKDRQGQINKIKKETKAKVDDDLLDDLVDVDGDGVADGTQEEIRQQKAEEGKQKVAAREQEFKDRQAHIDDIKANTTAKVDDDLLDDAVDVDGDGVADMTQKEAREIKAAEGKQKVADREQEFKDNQAEIDDIKANTKAKVDDDLMDDVASDGTSMKDIRAEAGLKT